MIIYRNTTEYIYLDYRLNYRPNSATINSYRQAATHALKKEDRVPTCLTATPAVV